MPMITMAVLGLFWGGSFIAIQAVVQYAPPASSAFWRVVAATMLTIVFAWFHRTPKPDRPYRVPAMVSGVLAMGLPWAMLFWAEQHVNGALGAIMNATVPIVVVLLNPIFHKGARVAAQQWVGILTAFVGVVVIFTPRVIQGPSSDGWAILALLGMVACYSTAIHYTHHRLTHVSATRVASWQGVSAGTVLWVTALVFGEPIASPVFVQNSTVWMGIAYLAIFSTFIANMIFVKIIQTRGTVAASLVTFLIPIFSMIIEWVWMGQRPSINSLAGLVLVLSGLYIVQFYKGRSRQQNRLVPPMEELGVFNK